MLVAALEDAVRSGSTEPAASPALARYVEKVRAHSYRVTDEDVHALRAEGASEEAIFEVTVVALVATIVLSAQTVGAIAAVGLGGGLGALSAMRLHSAMFAGKK